VLTHKTIREHEVQGETMEMQKKVMVRTKTTMGTQGRGWRWRGENT
jgi:hypothetical protein